LASRGVTAIELKKKSSDIAMMSIDPTQKRERPTLLHPLLPRFTDSKLERQYRDDRLGYRLTALRVSFVAGLAIWMLFVALDLLTIHDPSIPLFYIRIAGTLSLIPFFLATFLIKPGRWIEVIGFAAVFIQIVLLTALVAFLSPVSLPYYQPTEVWITIGVATFVVCGVSFIDGLILALGTVFGFFLSVTILQPEPLLLIAFDFAWLSAVLTFVGLGSYILDRTQHVTWLQEQELFEAEDQIRALLHNVLPPSIAARKLAGESPVADRFADASVLFADVVDFTSLSARLDSSQVVSMLNDLFSRFDRISARHGLEKIKTIGDCYMAAAGIPEPPRQGG
jgi:adenylate cyclase